MDDLEKSLKAAAGKPAAAKLAPPRISLAASLQPANRPRAAEPEPITDAFADESGAAYPTAVAVGLLGTGQGGCRIAKAFWDLGYRHVGAFNTTQTDFAGLPEEMPRLSLEIGGAAKDATLAGKSLDGRDQEVWDLMADAWGSDPELILITASLGGGTGSGTVTRLVRLARSYMRSRNRPERVGVVISLPAVNEGQRQASNTVMAFRALLKEKVSPMIIIDNDRINAVYRPSMRNLYGTANQIVAGLFHEFDKYAARRSEYMTFDRSEFMQLLDGGLVTMAAATIDPATLKSPTDVSSAIRAQLDTHVLAAVDLKTGRQAGCVFAASPEALDLPTEFFDAGYTQLDRTVGSAYDKSTQPTVIHRGLYPGDEPGLHCYTMVSGLEPPYAKLTEFARAGGTDTKSVSTMASLLGVD